MVGKLPHNVLEKYVFRRLGAKGRRVVLGPGVGVDAAVIDVSGSKYLVIHSDPITEAVSGAGWLAVNIAANDVAVAGGDPLWASIVILLPEGFSEDLLDEITRDIDRAAKELGISIVGGHTEEAPRLDRPIVVATVAGLAEKLLDPRAIEPGDVVIIAKNVGGEGASIIVNDFPELVKGLDPRVLEDAKNLAREVSVVREARTIRDVVKAMHDPTEGGVLGALYELAYMSKTVIEVYADHIPIPEPVRVVCSHIGIDPLKLISSGALIAVTEEERTEEVLQRLRSLGVAAEVAGKVIKRGEPRLIIHRGARVEIIKGFVEDEIAKLWGRFKR